MVSQNMQHVLNLLMVDGNQLSVLITAWIMLMLSTFSFFAIVTYWPTLFLALFLLAGALIGIGAALLRNKVLCIVYAVICGLCFALFGFSIIFIPFSLPEFSILLLIEALVADVFNLFFFFFAIVAAIFVYRDEKSQWKFAKPTVPYTINNEQQVQQNDPSSAPVDVVPDYYSDYNNV